MFINILRLWVNKQNKLLEVLEKLKKDFDQFSLIKFKNISLISS